MIQLLLVVALVTAAARRTSRCAHSVTSTWCCSTGPGAAPGCSREAPTAAIVVCSTARRPRHWSDTFPGPGAGGRSLPSGRGPQPAALRRPVRGARQVPRRDRASPVYHEEG